MAYHEHVVGEGGKKGAFPIGIAQGLGICVCVYLNTHNYATFASGKVHAALTVLFVVVETILVIINMDHSRIP